MSYLQIISANLTNKVSVFACDSFSGFRYVTQMGYLPCPMVAFI